MTAAGAVLLSAVLAAATPAFIVEGELEPRATYAATATAAWQALSQRFVVETQVEPRFVLANVRLRRATSLAPRQGAESQLGLIELRQARAGHLDAAEQTTLRHELAHQFLLAVCPAATEDRLFHEALALATSGELSAWTSGEYLSTPQALRDLRRVTSLDAPRARRALARLIAEGARGSGDLPLALGRRLRLCAAGARWTAPLSVDELAAPAAAAGAALVVLNRHSGEVLLSEGDASLPMPFGSTLKPFLVAGAGAAALPRLRPDRARSEWLCGDSLPIEVDGKTALLRSCNGYFLDWGAAEPDAKTFGAFGPLLVELGLGRLPDEMSEAIGLKPTLALSPWALAQAYRALAAASPTTLALLRDNSRRGTLSELPSSAALAGWATKTGTVRGPDSRPRLGLIVAVDDDLVVVKTVPERAPRTFAAEMVEDLARLPHAGQTATHVQTFALLPLQQVQAQCAGIPVIAAAAAAPATAVLRRGLDGFVSLLQRVEQGEAICLGAPWQVRFPGLPPEGRAYAGIFSLSPLPPPDHGSAAKPRQVMARRGSEIVFRTSLARYTAGVLAAEDEQISGAARLALGRVIAHNAAQPRHSGRPLCDTTHCQVFRGTQPPPEEDAQIFVRPPLAGGWLLFSRGGPEAWQSRHARAEVEALLGHNPTAMRISDGRLNYQRTVLAAPGAYDEAASLPCDLLRERLRLPSCPTTISRAGEQFVFDGRGWGHGQGLDVEWAKQSGLDESRILMRAYGAAILP